MTRTNGHNRGGLGNRLGALERRLGVDQEPDPATLEARERHLKGCEEEYRNQLESTATDLVLGLGPDLSYRDGAFYTPDGRLALSPAYMDIQSLMGSGYEERVQELQVEAWERCLSDDGKAEELVLELFEMADNTEAPESYFTWLTSWPLSPEDLAKAHHAGRTPPASEGIPSGCDGEPHMGPEKTERTRRLAWALVRDAGAREKLEELCRRRDAYVHT